VARRGPGLTGAQWQALAYAAVITYLRRRLVAPWTEIEAQLTRGWEGFLPIQPLQLAGARKQLRSDGLIVEETTKHAVPVTTLRIPFPPGRKTEIRLLAGTRRKLYRKYISWAADQSLCGKHAEKVVYESLQSAASVAGLFVPVQRVGEVTEIGTTPLKRGPLDVKAHILNLPDLSTNVVMAGEVKNTNSWIYPWAKELWELLVKAADIADAVDLLPVLVCMRYHWSTGQMAMDTGFLVCPLFNQLFSARIPEADFDKIVADFGLHAIRHEGPYEPVVSFAEKILRRSPPPSRPIEDVPWFVRQADRFRVLAPIVLAFESLAGNLPDDTRRNVFNAFRAQALSSMPWPPERGW
jgi:hypothetical protein